GAHLFSSTGVAGITGGERAYRQNLKRVRFRSAARCVDRGPLRGLRLVALAALLAQLGMLAHASVVVHVTCAAHGELVHARSSAAPPVWARGAVASAAVAATPEEHEQCLLDEDGDAACPDIVDRVAAPPAAGPRAAVTDRAASLAGRRAPLYRLAPKNSPPV